MPESKAVREMFARIAPSYDAANRLMSLGGDARWRKKLARMVARRSPKTVADFATGSGDVAFALRAELGEKTRVFGYDFCPEMLALARAKQAHLPDGLHIDFQTADCMDLSSVKEAPFDAITVSFGVRNFPDRARGFSEFAKCLREGSSLFMMEFSQPWAWTKPFYRAYLRYVLPYLARRAGATSAKDYEYLIQTVREFPPADKIARELYGAGFRKVLVRRFLCGAVAVHEAIK